MVVTWFLCISDNVINWMIKVMLNIEFNIIMMLPLIWWKWIVLRSANGYTPCVCKMSVVISDLLQFPVMVKVTYMFLYDYVDICCYISKKWQSDMEVVSCFSVALILWYRYVLIISFRSDNCMALSLSHMRRCNIAVVLPFLLRIRVFNRQLATCQLLWLLLCLLLNISMICRLVFTNILLLHDANLWFVCFQFHLMKMREKLLYGF